MGDYTSATLTVHRTTPEEAQVFLDYIIAEGFEVEWGAPAPTDRVLLDTAYTVHELNVAAAEDCTLQDQAPNSSFTLQLSPKYEWLGDLRIYTPELKSFRAECDDSGEIVMSLDRIIREVEALRSTRSIHRVLERLHEFAGTAWHQAIAALPSTVTEVVPS